MKITLVCATGRSARQFARHGQAVQGATEPQVEPYWGPFQELVHPQDTVLDGVVPGLWISDREKDLGLGKCLHEFPAKDQLYTVAI